MKTSLDRIPSGRNRNPEARHPIIPEKLQLPDGRTVEVSSITQQITNRANHNLLTKKTVKIPNTKGTKKAMPLKYSIEERVWQNSATIQEIADKYQISYARAQSIKYHSRYVLDKLEIAVETDK